MDKLLYLVSIGEDVFGLLRKGLGEVGYKNAKSFWKQSPAFNFHKPEAKSIWLETTPGIMINLRKVKKIKDVLQVQRKYLMYY